MSWKALESRIEIIEGAVAGLMVRETQLHGRLEVKQNDSPCILCGARWTHAPGCSSLRGELKP